MKTDLQVQQWPVEKLIPYGRNARMHSDEQVAQIAASILQFGWTNPILVGADCVVIAGHARLAAARKLGMSEVPVIVLDHLSETQRRALIIADNRLAELAGWDEELLRSELQELEKLDFDLETIGFSDEELRTMLEDGEKPQQDVADEVPNPPAEPVTRPGDLWLIGNHRLICGDCRDRDVIRALFGDALANVVITSPPYASQREYDASSGFKPIHPDEYVAWFRNVAAAIESVLEPNGSYFLNIKEHSEDGERNLYVKDLVIAHKRQWGWRFVDEFCWRNTANGVPGKWPNRLKNAWEPVFHFCRG